MSSEGAPEGDETHFHPVLKCCTFVPRLPNFLVGAVLRDQKGPEGTKRVEARIARRLGVSPLGIAPSKREARDGSEMSEESFGRTKSHVCPYLQHDDGRCSIWRHRNSVCTTWFCKHEHGAASLRFWDAAKAALLVIEQSLADHCVLVLDDARSFCLSTLESARVVEVRGPLALEEAEASAAYRRLWGSWNGREAEFFIRSADVVSRMSPDEVLGLGGARLALALERVRRAHDDLVKPKRPRALTNDPNLTLQLSGHDAVSLITYRSFDPIEAPKAILDVLPFFDGRPVPTVLRDVRRRTGLQVDATTLRQLIDFGVLRELE